MFDTHINKSSCVPYAKDVVMHEHKAPTDEAIKLLNEFHKEAVKNVVDSLSIKDNTFNMEVRAFSCDFQLNNKIVCKFSINGKEFVVEYNDEKIEQRRLAEKVVEKLYDEIVTTVSNLIGKKLN